MGRKRINHHVDIFCEMFSGWRLANDMETLVELKEGHLELDFLTNSVKLNGKPFDKKLNMLFEISSWFDKDLMDNKVDRKSILEASLIVDFDINTTIGKPKSRTKKITKFNFKMASKVKTPDKDYSTTKDRTIEYHFIEKK
jgi:hypothetical protein